MLKELEVQFGAPGQEGLLEQLVGGITGPETTAAALENLSHRKWKAFSGEEIIPFWYLPPDSELKKQVIVTIADALEVVASTNEDPNLRIAATAHLIDLCSTGYVEPPEPGAHWPGGITNPEQLLNMPGRLLGLIDGEHTPSVKGTQLNYLVAAYYESVMFPGNSPKITEEDWVGRVDQFIKEPDHPFESLALIEAMCCRESIYTYDESDLLEERARGRYSLTDVVDVIRRVPDADLRAQVAKAAAGLYNKVVEQYSGLTKYRRAYIPENWKNGFKKLIFEVSTEHPIVIETPSEAQ